MQIPIIKFKDLKTEYEEWYFLIFNKKCQKIDRIIKYSLISISTIFWSWNYVNQSSKLSKTKS